MADIDELAASLLARFQKEVPLSAEKVQRSRKMSTQDINKALDRFYDEAREARIRNKLGVVKSARLLFVLQRKFLAAGYPPDLVRKLVFSTVTAFFIKK